MSPTDREHFTDDHDAFRSSFAAFVAKEMTPHYLDWERDGIAPRELFAAAGLRLNRIVPTERPICVIEAVPA